MFPNKITFYQFFIISLYLAIPVSASTQMVHVKINTETNNEPQDESMSDDEQVITAIQRY